MIAVGLLRRLLGTNIVSLKGRSLENLETGDISPFLRKRIDKAMDALSRVIVPGYDVDLVSSGVVTRIRVRYDGSGILVFLDYQGSNPGCSFCRFLNDNVWRRILDDAKARLGESGFSDIVFVDSITRNPIVII
ncbi:MAG: iron-sulfur cluster assembly protein [Desulfurococcales archaeon]|nr:iron-sulfur cluster assembly protein [Desulfurococcales archaeon]